MNGEQSNGSGGSSSSSKTTSSGTSNSTGDSGPSGTHTTATSGSSKTSATIDRSHVTDSTANVELEITGSVNNLHIYKGGNFDLITKIAMLFQIVLWGAISILAYVAFKPLYLSAVTPTIASIFNPKINLEQGVFIPLILGLISSILATIIVLITREFFYHIRDYFPAGALFRGIAKFQTHV